MTHCFDVFDTVITRTFSHEEDLAFEVGRRIVAHNLNVQHPEDWVRVRQEAYIGLVQTIGIAHITLERIFEKTALIFDWHDNQKQTAMNIELEVELESMRVVPRMQYLIQKIHAKGEKVVFFSDTCLPKQFVQGLLEKAGIWTDRDLLYTSSERNADKYSGKLFELYLQEQNEVASDCRYYGNSEVSDMIPASKLGMKTVYVPDSNRTRYETAIRNTTENSRRITSYIAGASKLARLHRIELTSEEEIVLTCTANVAAPTLFFFVLWCIKEAHLHNIQRLYFVSRDGYILHKIALDLCKTLSITIDCRYLYASRYAWNNALKDTAAMRTTLGYLLQEGFGDGVSYAIVDIGWGGNLQDALYEILRRSTYAICLPVNGLYFAIFRQKQPAGNNIFRGYFSEGHHSTSRDFLFQDFGHRAALELFLPANHGTVSGYVYKKGIYMPEYLPPAPDIVSARGTHIIQETMMEFLHQITRLLSPQELLEVEGKEITSSILTMFLTTPSKQEAQTFGSQRFSPDLNNATYYELAPSPEEKIINQIFWKHGSAVRTGELQANTTKKKMLNIGCGDRYHPDWVNIDLDPASKEILQHDILRGLPFRSKSFDVVYHSHVLEHLSRKDGINFIRECRRVLKPGGIIRLAVPDLARLASLYLSALQAAQGGGELENRKHEWAILELYDQAVRTYPGGDVTAFIGTTTDIEMKQFLKTRWGKVANILLGEEKAPIHTSLQKTPTISFFREMLLKILLRNDYKIITSLTFEQSGEKHKWMYDSHSIGTLLANSGFDHMLERSPFQSYVPNWELYHLDTAEDGTVIKPDSIYVEGIAV